MQLILAYDSEYKLRDQLPISAWCLQNDEGAIVHSGGSDTLESIKKTTHGFTFTTQVLLISPDVMVTQIPRPAGSASKIRQALPYLLEEQVAEDIEELHFAILNQADTQTLVIAVVERSIMRQCIDDLTNAGFIPQTVLPLWLALPQPGEGQWIVLTDSDYIWVRTGLLRGFACERALALPWLTALYSKQVPAEIVWVTINNVEPEWLADCEARNIATSIITLTGPTAWLTYVAQQYKPKGMNLLQGEFSVSQTTVSERRWWQMAKVLAASIVVVWFSGLVAQSLFLSWEHQHIQKQIADVYQEVFPQAKPLGNPRPVFERELNSAASGKGSNDFLSLLLRAGEVITQFQQTQITGISYDSNQLVLNITVDNFSRLQKLDEQMSQQGLTIEQENATSSGGIVQARWRIG